MTPYPKCVPNFFLVGAPKAGTTSLYHYLDQHPQIYMSPIKEPNYFAAEIRPENLAHELQAESARDQAELREYLQGPMTDKRFGGMVIEWEDYLRLFQSVREEKAIGEASVCYLWSKTAAENIRRSLNRAKIIIVLRDPAERAFSQYLQCFASGRIRESFAQHIDRSRREAGEKFTVAYPLLELGLYYEQVKRFLEAFGEASVLILLYEEYSRDVKLSLRRIYQFLEVDPDFAADTSQRFLEGQLPRFPALMGPVRKLSVLQPGEELGPSRFRSALKRAVFRRRMSHVMEAADRASLIEYYKNDVRKLADLLGWDLSAWLL
jgi:hypothetical protein